MYEYKARKEELLTSSETVDAWGSREMAVSLAFFAHLRFWA
jgi:hypothetical protein